jgi:hypothetical protein
MLGHRNEDATRKTANALGWMITQGTLGVCQACTEAKAKQKNVPMHPYQPPSTRNEGWIYLDIVTVRKTKNGPKVTNGNWRLMVDKHSGLKFSKFYEKKSDMVELTCEHFNRWAQHSKPVKFV